MLRVFSVDPATRMHPHLDFAPPIPARTAGRGGIIDTLQLISGPGQGCPGLKLQLLDGAVDPLEQVPETRQT